MSSVIGSGEMAVDITDVHDIGRVVRGGWGGEDLRGGDHTGDGNEFDKVHLGQLLV